MVSIKIYIEGGGEGKDLDIRFREAWSRFFKRAGLAGKMPRPVRGKGRANTFDLFSTAIQHCQPGEIPILLLDSEDPVKPDNTVWQHLKAREGWDKPNKATNEHAYLMVQVMETWLLADLANLSNFFGSKFKPDKIADWPDLEAVPKLSVLDALYRATAQCGKRQYAKGRISFDVFGQISPELVQQKCPQAKLFLEFLKKKR